MGVIKEQIRWIFIFLYYEFIIQVQKELKELFSLATIEKIKESFSSSFKPNSSIIIILFLASLNLYLYGFFQRMTIIIIFSLLLIFLRLYKRWTIGEYKGWYRKQKGSWFINPLCKDLLASILYLSSFLKNLSVSL